MIAAAIETVIRPIEEDYHSCLRFLVLVKPLTFSLEPISAVINDGILWNDTVLDIAALIGAPTDETAAPLDARAETIPRPIWLTTDITELFLRYLNNITVRAARYAVQYIKPIISEMVFISDTTCSCKAIVDVAITTGFSVC